MQVASLASKLPRYPLRRRSRVLFAGVDVRCLKKARVDYLQLVGIPRKATALMRVTGFCKARPQISHATADIFPTFAAAIEGSHGDF
jgi:hypothetical protein